MILRRIANSIRLNTRFKNDLIDNSSRHEAYFNILTQQQEYLSGIHAELDRILASTHADGSPS